MKTDYKKLKPTDTVDFDGPDAFKYAMDAQKKIIAYMSSLTPEQKEKERAEAQKRIDARKAAGEEYDYDAWPLRPIQS